jgi:branched-subunit amino acid transport protein
MNPAGSNLSVAAIWAAIIGVTLTALVTRLSFLVLGERARLPPRLESVLRYAPACALAAIVVPDLLMVGGQLELDWHNHRLVAGLCAAAVMLATRSILWTIVVGMGLFSALRLWL